MSAQESSETPLYDFMYPKFLLKDLFDVSIQEDDYVERAYMVYRQINTFYTHPHMIEVILDDDHEIKLPCNVFRVGALTADTAYIKNMSTTVSIHRNESNNYDVYVADELRQPISAEYQYMRSHLHPEGQFIPYEHMGKKLLVDKQWVGKKLYLQYEGIILDDTNLPCLFRKTAEAIAYKLAHLDAQKRYFKGDPIARQLYIDLKPTVERLIQAAKIPDSLSQNFLNRMLAAQTRHDRKVFYNSYKLMQ